jgi:hypothetical protein
VEGLHEKDWQAIDHSKREEVNIQHLRYQIDVRPAGNSVTLQVTATGTPDVPVKFELIFEADGMLTTANTTLPAMPGGYMIAGERFAYARFGEKLMVDGGFNCHDYAPAMRGSEPMPQNAFCVFFTGFTPLDNTIIITAPPYAEG